MYASHMCDVFVRAVVKEDSVPERWFVCAVGVCVADLGYTCVCVLPCVCFCQSLPVCVCLVLLQGGNSGGRSLQSERPWAFGVQQGLFTARAPP